MTRSPPNPSPPDGGFHRLGSTAGFLAVQMGFLVAAHGLGGPPWVGLGVLACVGQILADFRLASLLRLVPALLWVVAHAATGNRELFFPYAIFLATHVATEFCARGIGQAGVGGGIIVAVFLAIRFLQRATPRVLGVESVVAIAIVAAAIGVVVVVRRPRWMAWVIPPVASLVAYAALAIP